MGNVKVANNVHFQVTHAGGLGRCCVELHCKTALRDEF